MTPAELAKFRAFLEKSGAVLVPPTNQWELVRFRTENGVSIVYTNSRGRLTFTNEAEQAWEKFGRGHGWRSVSRRRQSVTQKKKELAERDGCFCFFCGAAYSVGDLTVEHLLSFSHGGSDNANNLCLACEPCNRKVSNLSVVQKVLMRESLRKQNDQ